MKRATSLLFILVLSALCIAANIAPPSTAPAALAIIHGPCLQAPTDTSITLVWATGRNCVSRVEYGLAPGKLDQTAIATHHGLIDANTTLHCIPLAGLKPGTTYSYRVVSKEIVDFKSYKVIFGDTVQSDELHFTTLDPAKQQFSFITFNDRHDKVAILNTALAGVNWEGVDLVFYNGDMASDVKNEQQVFTSLIDPATRFFATQIPLVFTRGNHETRGAFSRMLPAYMPTGTGHYYRSFTHGPVHFTVLDCGEDKGDDSNEYFGLVDFKTYMDEQTNWLREEVHSEAFKKASFRVAILHIPPQAKVDAKFIRPKWLLDNWVPMLNEAKLDFMLSGHTHKYEEVPSTPGQNAFPILIGGTETVIRVNASSQYLDVIVSNNPGTKTMSPIRIERTK
jgi:acid phosphatase type 7